MKKAKRWGLFVVVAGIGALTLASCGPDEPAGGNGRRGGGRPRSTEPGGGETTEPGAMKPMPAGDLATQIAEAQKSAAAWLAGAQREDGGWGTSEASTVGITGLILEGLAELPDSVRATHADVIEKGVQFVLSKKRDDGSIVGKSGQLANYRTSIAVRALVAIDAAKYKETIDAGVKYIKGIQREDGSIGYGSNPNHGDAINTTEAIEALREAGVPADDPAVQKALGFLKRLQNLDEVEGEDVSLKTSNDGGGIYRADRSVSDASKAGNLQLPDGTAVPKSYGSATYALLKGYLFCGLKKDHPRVVAARKWLSKNWAVDTNPAMGKQGLYYYWYTMARALSLWDEATLPVGGKQVPWAKELARAVVAQQKGNGSWANAAEERWWEGNPNLATGYAVNVLNLCDDVVGK
jgi:squalene-hopene/tetraprenyl-beta-curcumene cyclase